MKFVIFTALAVLACAVAPIPGFRPPAIPFIVSDPYTQVWLRGDDAFVQEGTVYWDGNHRGMLGLLRVDGQTYRFVGARRDEALAPVTPTISLANTEVSDWGCDTGSIYALSEEDCNRHCGANPACKGYVLNNGFCFMKSCAENLVYKEGVTAHLMYSKLEKIEKKNMAPGVCDLANFENTDADHCAFACANNNDCKGFVMHVEDNHCFLKSCIDPLTDDEGSNSYIMERNYHIDPEQTIPTLTTKSVVAYPTRTVFEMELDGVLSVTLTTLSPLLTDKIQLLSRPVTMIALDVKALDGKEHDVQVYFDVTSEIAAHHWNELMQWEKWENSHVVGAQIGTVEQEPFGVWGDHVNINWGFSNLAVAKGQTIASGFSKDLRDSFINSGAIPTEFPTGPWRAVKDNLPTLAAVHNIGKVGTKGGRALFGYGLDEEYAMYYFGKKLRPLWTQYYTTIGDAFADAFTSYEDDLAVCVQHDEKLLEELEAKVNDEYATLCALAYHQTLAATKLVWNPETGEPEMFLKEISTNGDIQTVDVVYPASPLFMYTNPKLLEMLLVPMLRYANNETWIPYTKPFSPHELGVYPFANHTTEEQEPMPMENTGNMYFMIQAILQRNGGDASFFYPQYWNMLVNWADYLDATLPFPESQLCTDDFCGHLANNTNLAGKGVVALAVFADICQTVTGNETFCNVYREHAIAHAQTWYKHAYIGGDLPHTCLTFNDMSTWSAKYNLVWQRVLNMGTVPFENYDQMCEDEVNFYLSVFDNYGTPLDVRHDWIKLDWLSWLSILTKDVEKGNKFLHAIYRMANETPDRCPLTDWFISGDGSAHSCSSFVARPVNGGLFLRAMVDL